MDELIPQDIEAIKNEAEDASGVTSLKRKRKRSSGSFETVFPVFEPVDAIVMLPEWIEDEAVLEQQPD